jgi:serine/threonine protein kinase
MEQLQPGQMLGPYRIIGKIGQGGMATVYKAYQASMDRNVAVKVLPGQLAESDEFSKRFRQEARTIARLEHPHILPVIDFGEDDGTTYFVMRYLEGGTLKSRMEAGPLALDEIDRIFTQLCDALGYAHAHGVVHRDLKPANALVDEDGNIFLTDFGIAKILESASPRLTQTDAIMGTPAYISPEQAQAQQVDKRSDIYSLGIILFEMVTGRVPFVADTPLAVILKHLSDPLPLPSVIKADIPQSIENILLKALAKNREDRFASTSEFLASWKRALREMETIRPQTQPPAVKVAPPPVQPVARPVPSQPLPVSQTQPKPAPVAVATASDARPSSMSKSWMIGCGVLACIVLSMGGIFFATSGARTGPTATSTSVPTETPLPTDTLQPTDSAYAFTPTLDITATALNALGKILFEDDFGTSNRWKTGTNKDTSIEYLGDALNFQIFNEDAFAWSKPNDEYYENIHLEVTIINYGTDPHTAIGFMCNRQSDEDSYHFFAMTPSGYIIIGRSEAGERDYILTDGEDWEYSNIIPEEASSYRIGLDCSNDGTLTVYVNGEMLTSVVDDYYTGGGVGLLAWSAGNFAKIDISFDDFLITNLR